MATANDIINRAGRRAKILAGEEAFSAAEASDALQLLNDMMAALGPRGVYYVHAPLTATAAVNMPDEQIRNLILLFAEELMVDYGVAADPVMASLISGALSELQAAYWMQPPADTDPMLRQRRFDRTDITRIND